jgi:Abortive infection alpha
MQRDIGDLPDMTDPDRQSDRPGGELDAIVSALGAATREIRRAARAIPGVRAIEAQTSAGERFLLKRIKRRLDQLDPPRVAPGHSFPETAAPAPDEPYAATEVWRPTLEQRMEALLTRSIRNTPAESRHTLHEVLISELVPDEARILSALSDGSIYPLVHIAEPGVGSYQKLVLENASSVGRAAGVALPDRVHLYVSHLRRLGLVESGPEDHSLKDEYEILLTEPKLRRTITSIGKGPRGARIIRRTVRISDLGRELWEAARSPESVDADQPDLSAG